MTTTDAQRRDACRRRRIRHGAALLGACGLAGLGLAQAASAAPTSCSYAAGAVTLNMDVNANVMLYVDAASRIVWLDLNRPYDPLNPFTCNGATRFNTDSVRVNGTTGNDILQIAQGSAPFAPGATAELDGTPEIEFDVRLGAGPNDELWVGGTPGPDHLTAGSDGLSFSADDDADIVRNGIDRIGFNGMAGDDVVSGQGGYGTGLATGIPLTVLESHGAGGNDVIVGGKAGDELHGGTGDDSIDGRQGRDLIFGDAGRDTLIGGVLDDTIFARDGEPDTIRGNAGRDTAQVDAVDDVRGVEAFV